ncbi:MAG TPA: hypothetical protein VMS00_08115 [Acidimicrobiales bacterium]|nr:hypothetical protein [Acidimicrobiales bacterium]
MAVARRGLPSADGSPRPAPQAHDDHGGHCDYEAGGHAALEAAHDEALDAAHDAGLGAACDRSSLPKISIPPRLTRSLPRIVPQSVPRGPNYLGKLCEEAGTPPSRPAPTGWSGARALGPGRGPELYDWVGADMAAGSAAVESGADPSHELAHLTGRGTVERRPHQS